MINEENNPLNIIEEANSKTLDYFNKTYVSNLELVQSLKTELFELGVQIETLEKTRELYTYQVDNRRNVFSPLSNEHNESLNRGKQIVLQIKDLEDARERLKKRIADLEQDVQFYKEHVEMLCKASKCIHSVLVGRNHEDLSDDFHADDAIEFIETEDSTCKTTHNYTALMLQDFEHFQYATDLEQHVKQEMISNSNKIDVLKWLLHSDIGRAKVTLDEIQTSQQSILDTLDKVINKLSYNIDLKQPVKDLIDQLINGYKQQYPDFIIAASCDCTEHDLHLPSVITIRLVNMLREIFDNIFKHSNADQIVAKIVINNRLVDVNVNDNGVGIPEDYLDRSNWSSGLHKLHETIYQLDGNLQIQGDLISGTNVRFSFPIKNTL